MRLNAKCKKKEKYYNGHREPQRYWRCTEKLISVALIVPLWFTAAKKSWIVQSFNIAIGIRQRANNNEHDIYQFN